MTASTTWCHALLVLCCATVFTSTIALYCIFASGIIATTITITVHILVQALLKSVPVLYCYHGLTAPTAVAVQYYCYSHHCHQYLYCIAAIDITASTTISVLHCSQWHHWHHYLGCITVTTSTTCSVSLLLSSQLLLPELT